ncbi:hypothetical protein [Bradyrhizobium sp. WSM471]|uniref:hypothetical protein n=1 Tax=Bradyrhizobium sp. WSM471 TaxID=319017 RepID=UPI0018DEEAE4|nr:MULTISPECIES: hypothetical protein [Bradyrhizobium]UFW45162.1 hypothetical protein BcanWSM471_07160 [Bradyrhizobium canariense]
MTSTSIIVPIAQARRDIYRHGVALLRGISTQSLLAQGGQRRPLEKFNRTRDIAK